MIDRIETAYYRLPLAGMGDAGHGRIDTEELILTRVYADGLVGHGYAYTIGRGGRAVRSLIDGDLAPLILGHDAADVEGLWELMWRRMTYVGRGGLVAFAVAAIDIALWDLRGLRAGQPLYALLGATSRAISAYGSGVDLPMPTEELLAQTARFVERGFGGVKVKVGRPDPADDDARVAAVRRLIGPKVDLLIDANMSWDLTSALARAGQLSRHDLYWLEEPLIPEAVADHRILRAKTGLRISVGESLHSIHEFASYAEAGAASVFQIDPVTNGGITVSRQVLALADRHSLLASSHYTDELSAHLLCAAAQPVYLEKHAFALDPFLETPQAVVAGCVRPTDVPGTGLRFIEGRLREVAIEHD